MLKSDHLLNVFTNLKSIWFNNCDYIYRFKCFFNTLSHDSTLLLAVLKMSSIRMCLYLLDLLQKAKKWKVTELERALIWYCP